MVLMVLVLWDFKQALEQLIPLTRITVQCGKAHLMSGKTHQKLEFLKPLMIFSAMQKSGMLTITPAMGGKHVVNCPFFESNHNIRTYEQNIALSSALFPYFYLTVKV